MSRASSTTRSDRADSETPTEHTPLFSSLLAIADSPTVVSAELVASIPTENNPRPLPAMGDYADYWVGSDGTAAVVRFPAVLDFDGHYGRAGPYFNMSTSNPLDIPALKKARIQFELKPLSDVDDYDILFPESAVQCSTATLKTFMAFVSEVEDKRNQSVSEQLRPTCTPFWRTYESQDRYSLIVTSAPLFENLPDPKNLPPPAVSRADIGKSSAPLSPSKVKKQMSASGSASPTKSPVKKGVHEWKVANLPDPDGRYSRLLGQHNLDAVKIVPPNVRDKDDVLVHPGEYHRVLKSGTVVAVDAILKLYSIRASGDKRGTEANTQSKGGNGSRVYHIVLRRLQILPFTNITKGLMFSAETPVDGKGKRKARNERDGDDIAPSSSSKKKTRQSKSDDPFAMETVDN